MAENADTEKELERLRQVGKVAIAMQPVVNKAFDIDMARMLSLFSGNRSQLDNALLELAALLPACKKAEDEFRAWTEQQEANEHETD